MTVGGTRKGALVTGAAQGIGAAIAKDLAKEGYNVALADLPFQEKHANSVIEDIKKTTPEAQCFFVGCDVSCRNNVFEAVELAYETFGTFDVIVNNAGIAITKALLDITEADALKVFGVNVNGVLWGIQAASSVFKRTNHPNGKIINACSISGYREATLLATYGASKFAVRSLTQTAAKELAQYKITVNAFCPGIVDTPMWEKIDSQMSEEVGKEKGDMTKAFSEGIALGRLEQPEDITGLVSFLASDKSNYITGQSIIVDGGIIFS